MRESDDERFAVVISAMAATFGVEADVAMFQGYWMALADLPFEVVDAACAAALRECKFFPRPQEIRRLACLRPEERAAAAWATVARLAKHSGCERRAGVKLKDPLAAKTVRQMGGWSHLGRMKEQEFSVWGRREFERLYVMFAERQEIDKRLVASREVKKLPAAKVTG